MSVRSKITYGLNAVKKLGRKHPTDPDINRIIEDVYSELNKLNDSVNLKAGSFTASPGEGKDGDIRLYKGTGYDGSEGYFLQGKFNDGWGTVQLTLETTNPDNAEVSNVGISPTIGDGNAMLSDINYDRLDQNLSVGFATGKVAPGVFNAGHGDQKLHKHWSGGADDDPGSGHHNKIHFLLGGNPTALTPDIAMSEGSSTTAAKSDHVHNVPTAPTVAASVVSTTHAATDVFEGTESTFARSDHKHEIDEDMTPTWTEKHTWSCGTDNALDITGDVSIVGNLNVTYAASATTTTNLTGDVNIGTHNTFGNALQIHGPTTIGDSSTFPVDGSSEALNVHGLSILYGNSTTGDPAVTVKNDAGIIQLQRVSDANDRNELKIDSSGNAILAATGNIQLLPNSSVSGETTASNSLEGSVLPKGTRVTDMGAFNRLWRTGYFAEIYAETLVAQDVLATIGGRIMVAPTTTVEATLTTSSTILKTAHNNLFPGDICLLKAAPAGLPTQEYIQITSGPTWTDKGTITAFTDMETGVYEEADSGSMRNLYPERNLQTLVTLNSAHGMADGDFVIISGTGGNASDGAGFDGAYKIAYLTGSSNPAVTSGPCTTSQFAISAPFVSVAVVGGTVKSGPFQYRIARNLDNTLPNQWNIGDAVTNLGYKEGDGYIDLTSTRTIHNQLGPQMAIFARSGTNLITNGDFESNITDGWEANTGISHNTTAEHIYIGSGSAKLSRGAESSNDIRMYTDAFGTAVVDDVYIVELWAKSSKKAYLSLSETISGTAAFKVVKPSDGTLIDCHSSNTQVEISGNTWQRVTWYCKCSSVSEGTDIRFVIWHGEQADDAAVNIASSDIYIDKVSVYKNPKLSPGSGEESIYGTPVIGVGNLNSYVDYNTDSLDYFGMALGKNLTSSPSTGFKGATIDGTNGLRLFNTPFALYDGSNLRSEIKIGENSAPEFWLGQDTSGNKSFRIHKHSDDTYKVTILQGSLSIVNGSGAAQSFLNSALDWDADIAGSNSNVPNFLNTSWTSQAGIHITDTHIGFNSGNSSGANWPVVISNDSGTGKMWLGAGYTGTGAPDTSGTNYLYWDGSTLNIKGAITVMSGSTAYDGAALDTMVSNTTTAQTTANTANTAAGTAQTAAEDAQGTADTANSTANTANTTANTANTNVNSIISGTQTLTSNITISEGNITIGNVAGSYIASHGKVDTDPESATFGAYVNREGFYLGNSYHSDGQNKFDLHLGKSSGSSFFWDGNGNWGNGSLTITNGNFEINNTDVDIFIGQNTVDQESDSQDDILIGTWANQADSSGAGNGILVKHDKYDYSKLYKGGFNRAGFDYPIHIHKAWHWGGPAYKNANNWGAESVPSDTYAIDLGYAIKAKYGSPVVFPTFPEKIYGNNITSTTGPSDMMRSYLGERTYAYNEDGSVETQANTLGSNITQYKVPPGRKLIWTFDPKIMMTGDCGNDTKFVNDTAFGFSDGVDYSPGGHGHVLNRIIDTGTAHFSHPARYTCFMYSGRNYESGNRAVTWDCRYHLHHGNYMTANNTNAVPIWKLNQWGVNAELHTWQEYGENWNGNSSDPTTYSRQNNKKYYNASMLLSYLIAEQGGTHPHKNDSYLSTMNVSYGTIPSGTYISNMYLVAATNITTTALDDSDIFSGIHGGILEIWEVAE